MGPIVRSVGVSALALLALACSLLVDVSGLSGNGTLAEAGGPADAPSSAPDAAADAMGPPLDAGCSADLANDGKNCGACGRACAGSCAGGLCDPVMVATGISQGGCLLVDGAFVEWSSQTMLSWKPKAGGPTLTTHVEDGPEILDCLNVGFDTYVAFNSTVDTVPLRTTSASTTRVISSRDSIRRIAVGSGKHLFWLRSDSNLEGCASGDATCASVASTLITGMNDLRDIVADDQRIYWTNYDQGKILSLKLDTPHAVGPMPPDGGFAQPTAVSASAGKPTALVKNGDDVVWADDTGRILRARADGSAAAVVLASGQPAPTAIAADSANVYWATANGRLLRVSLAGGQPQLVAKGAAARIAIDDTDLYWIERNASGNIYRVTK